MIKQPRSGSTYRLSGIIYLFQDGFFEGKLDQKLGTPNADVLDLLKMMCLLPTIGFTIFHHHLGEYDMLYFSKHRFQQILDV